MATGNNQIQKPDYREEIPHQELQHLMHDKNLLEVAVQYARENRNSLYVRMNEHHSEITKRNKKTSKPSRPECPSGSWTSKQYQRWGADGLLYETCRLERVDF